MDFVIHDPSLSSTDLSAAAMAVADTGGVCIEVLNQDGRTGATSSGATDPGDNEGLPAWVDLWDSETHEAAVQAVALAFGGESGAFKGRHSAADNGGQRWSVEVHPFEKGDDGAVTRVLAVSRPIVRDMAVGQALHDLSNIVTEVQGAARILGRDLGPEMAAELAQHLTVAGKRAGEALTALRAALEE